MPSLAESRLGVDAEFLAIMSRECPRVPWDEFVIQHLQWRPGEHFALIGPTGQGKTTMLMNLLPLHPYNVVFAVKPKDETMDELIASDGYIKLEHWRSLDANEYPHRVLWPDAYNLDSTKQQRAVFLDAMNKIYREGHWTVAVDETWYIANTLKLGNELKLILMLARAMKLCLIAASQRPAHIPLEIYDQSTHLMFWRDNDETNLKRISGISWRSANLIRRIVANLEPHQVLYVNTRTGEMMRTRCPKTYISSDGGEHGSA
jgi:energy-coupling factor transporter ATP-binding protein EcfA2